MFQILFIKRCKFKHVFAKYGLIGSSLLPYQGLTGTELSFTKFGVKLRHISSPHFITKQHSQITKHYTSPNMVSLEVPYFRMMDRLVLKCYVLKYMVLSEVPIQVGHG